MSWRRRIRVVGVVLAVVVVQVLAVLAYRRIERGRQNANATFSSERVSGARAGELVLLHADGSTRRLSDHRGRPVVVHFWATWCPPCREELPGVLAVGDELARDEGIEVIAVSLDRDWDAVQRFFGGAIPARVVRDGHGNAVETFGLSTLPDTYVVDPEGFVRLRIHGARDWRAASLREVIRSAARPSP